MTPYTENEKNEILKGLHEGTLTVSFKKVNGDRRDMRCTLNETHIPPKTSSDKPSKARKQNPDVQSVWDINAKGWRSFRWENVIEFGEDDGN